MKKITCFILFALLTVSQSFAQVGQYGFTQSSGAYAEITDGTVLDAANSSSSLDSSVYPVTFSFPFLFNGADQTLCNISSNGFVSFGSVAPGTTLYTPLSSTAAFNGIVSAWAGDINAVYNVPGVNDGEISWKEEGVSPNREIIIQYKNFRPAYTTSTTNVAYFNFQIRLQETTGKVSIVYGPSGTVGAPTTSGTRQIGLRGATAADFNNRTNAATILFDASTQGLLNTNTQAFNVVNATPGMPASGLTYAWIPPTCVAPANITTVALGTSATINWTAPNPIPTAGYEYYYSTTATAPTPATLAMGSVGPGVLTKTITGLNFSTNYFVWVRGLCSGSDVSAWSLVSPFTTLCDFAAITSVTGGSVCGQGTVALSAEVAAPDATINWYTAASGGAPIASGATFTTPSIATTTSYYAAASKPGVGSVTLGAGANTATSYDGVFYHLYGGAQTQFLVKASELTALGLTPGNITSLGINIASAGTQAYAGFAVGVAATTNTTLTALSTASFSTVYTNASYVPVTGINNFAFTAPFNWDGTSNVIIKFCWSNNNGGGTSTFAKVDNPGFACTAWYRADNQTDAAICGGTTASSSNSSRPQFVFSGQAACLSPRMEVVATVTTAPDLALNANVATICAGESTAAFTITTNVADYTTYSWSPATGVTGDEVTGWIFNPSATTTYTLTASNASGCAKSVTNIVTVNPLPAIAVIAPATATVCAGTVQALTTGTAGGTAVLGAGTTSPGTTSYPNPLSAYYGGVKHQMLVTAAELTAQGLTGGSKINGLTFNLSNAVVAACADFTIRMGSTTQTDLTGFVAGTTDVYGPATYSSNVIGLANFTFTTPYTWDGVSNVIVETVHNAGNSGNGSGTRAITSTTPFVSVYYGAKDNVAGGVAGYDALTAWSSFGTSSLRPDMTFAYTNLGPVWSPVDGLFTDAAATVPYTGGNAYTVYAKPSAATDYIATLTSAAGCPIASVPAHLDVNVVLAPTGDTNQTLAIGSTVADLQATGTGIVWYDSLAGALAGQGALAADTPLVNNATYFATQTENNCISTTALSVTVELVLASNNFAMAGLKYFPNPVVNAFTLQYTNNITSVEVYNLVGQRVIAVQPNAVNTTIDMSALAAGSYLVQVKSNNTSKTIKVIKN